MHRLLQGILGGLAHDEGRVREYRRFLERPRATTASNHSLRNPSSFDQTSTLDSTRNEWHLAEDDDEHHGHRQLGLLDIRANLGFSAHGLERNNLAVTIA